MRLRAFRGFKPLPELSGMQSEVGEVTQLILGVVAAPLRIATFA